MVGLGVADVIAEIRPDSVLSLFGNRLHKISKSHETIFGRYRLGFDATTIELLFATWSEVL
jgi:hypothetical protein